MGSKSRVCLLLLNICGIFYAAECSRPRQCLDKFRIYQNHTMCIADPSDSTNSSLEIEEQHNYVRGNVSSPPASKMLEMGYSNALEKEAQTWADTCSLTHDDPYFRFMPGRYHVGQNIYISDKALTWTEVIGKWASEKGSFQHGKTSNINDVSNYTQLVWAESQLIGCGKQMCGNRYFYVCNYAPGMDPKKFNTPYESGPTGSLCQNHFSNTTSRLCSCVGLFCTNGADLDLGTCQCQCLSGTQLYSGLPCELNCTADQDHPDCSKMTMAACRNDYMAPFKCPWLCKVCPYSGKEYRQGSIRMPWETTTTSSTTPAAGNTGVPNMVPTNTFSNSHSAGTKSPNPQRSGSFGIKGSVVLASALCIVVGGML